MQKFVNQALIDIGASRVCIHDCNCRQTIFLAEPVEKHHIGWEFDMDLFKEPKALVQPILSFTWEIVWNAIVLAPRGYYAILCGFGERENYDWQLNTKTMIVGFSCPASKHEKSLLAFSDYQTALRICLMRRGVVNCHRRCSKEANPMRFEIIMTCDPYAISLAIENAADRIADVFFAKEAVDPQSHVFIGGALESDVYTYWILIDNASFHEFSQADCADSLESIRLVAGCDRYRQPLRQRFMHDCRFESMRQFAVWANEWRIPDDIVNLVREFVCCGILEQ